ncbi:hypothetical protein HDU77_009752 [Chytriomyces hyalinus]|nr:hypothetical protein HDU77_009752 [Chytriomyces hyalinus]
MQGPAPTATAPEARTASEGQASASNVKVSTSVLDETLQAEASSPSYSTVPSDQDQVPDDQAEIGEDSLINQVTDTDQRPPALDSVEHASRPTPAPTYTPNEDDVADEPLTGEDGLVNQVGVTDQRPPVLDSMESSPRSTPAPTYAPTQDDVLDELETGLEALQVQAMAQVHFEVVLTTELDPNVPRVNRDLSFRPSNALSAIPAPFSVIMDRDGFPRAYTDIHFPFAYIARAVMKLNDTVSSLRVHDAIALITLHFQVVLTRHLHPNIQVGNLSILSRPAAAHSVIVTRNGVSVAHTDIQHPLAYIAQLLTDESEY